MCKEHWSALPPDAGCITAGGITGRCVVDSCWQGIIKSYARLKSNVCWALRRKIERHCWRERVTISLIGLAGGWRWTQTLGLPKAVARSYETWLRTTLQQSPSNVFKHRETTVSRTIDKRACELWKSLKALLVAGLVLATPRRRLKCLLPGVTNLQQSSICEQL